MVPVLLAAAPLGVVLVGLGVLKRSAAVAGVLGVVVATVLALTYFRPAGSAATLALVAGAEAAHATATILWIILPALALFAFQKRTGAIDRIRNALAHITEERRVQAILIAWFFGLFVEGAAGFGTPVALGAPLLVGLGYSPARAVSLALLGHAAGVSFGAVGTPVLAQVEVTGLGGRDIAGRTATLHAIAAPVLLGLMVRLAGDTPLTRAELGTTGLAALCFLVPYLAIAWTIGPELPTLGGALIGVSAFIAIRLRGGRAAGLGFGGLRADLLPYLVILVLVLFTRLIPPLRQALASYVWQWEIAPGATVGFQPAYHPGTILLLGLLAGALVGTRRRTLGGAVAEAIWRILPVALALLAMLALSRIMVQFGMIDLLAAAAARTGVLWPLLSPAVGVLGTFITGSATASNILFSELQVTTATALSLGPGLMAASQGFGAAIGNVIAPHNIIAGSATVGMIGREGDVLTRTSGVCAVYVALGGLVLLLAAAWG
ncbi:L-lactate permease [Tranquillimonas alkanivorans]|uniref:L-lactate permease n=1 Tax=Tranquillimonas alkanivorans TaxID=441119 RepID=A0A1I5V4C3_9RHOB|nr:L-lactate permease [Tranquillimonas alkanivorans]SFQ02167.1 lactate permease [Tranquillimonas alkanivorans]